MKLTLNYRFIFSFLALITLLSSNPVTANGLVGEHVNHLSDNMNKYTEEVHWLIEKVDGIVSRYNSDGAKAAKADAVVEHWEEVDFHAAIETNYVPVYASIWQGLYGVKQSIDNNSSITKVREEQEKLEQVLWQALGAVKLAAQYQERGLLDKIKVTKTGPTNSIEALSEIKMRLDKVVAKYAEKLVDTSVNIVHDTYLNLFEGVEGELIALNADLVEDLEKDFNVTLPQALQQNTGVDNVRKVVNLMQGKLDQAKSLLKKAEQGKKDVF